MPITSLRVLTPEETRDETIIQDIIKGHDIALVAHAHGVSLEHIQGLFVPPRFGHSNATVKAIELARLDIATRALMPQVEAGDAEAIGAMLKVQTRRSKYLGLDSPVQAEVKSEMTIKHSFGTPNIPAHIPTNPDGSRYFMWVGNAYKMFPNGDFEGVSDPDLKDYIMSMYGIGRDVVENDVEDAKPAWRPPAPDAATSLQVRRLVRDARAEQPRPSEESAPLAPNATAPTGTKGED